MTDFLTALWALLAGLRLWFEFFVLIVIACLALTGGLTLLELADRAYEKRQVRRGRVRVLDLRTGRERWESIETAVRRG